MKARVTIYLLFMIGPHLVSGKLLCHSPNFYILGRIQINTLTFMVEWLLEKGLWYICEETLKYFKQASKHVMLKR